MKTQSTKILATTALGLCIAIPAFALGQTTSPKSEQCEVEFRSGTTLEDEAEIPDCVQEFKALKLTRIEVMGYASKGGSASSNRAVSQSRADLVGTRLSEAFPGVTIDAKGMGMDDSRGRAAIVTAYYIDGTAAVSSVGKPSDLGTTTPKAANAATDPITGDKMVDESSNSTAGARTETPAGSVNSFPQGLQKGTTTPSASSDMAAGDFPNGSNATSDGSIVAAAGNTTATTDAGTPLQREDIASGWNDVRVAGRVGYDKLWDRNEFMNSAGVDVAYVRRNVGTKLVRLEVGATTSFMGEFGEDLKAYNFHGVVFPALEIGPLVFGPRGLLGGSWDDASKETVIDAGGEGRLGIEAANYSIFIGAGRTQELTRVGLDIGATF